MAALRGVNIAGWLDEGAAGGSGRSAASFISQGDLERLASWRFTHVRVPIEDAVLETPEVWAAVDWIVGACARAGLRCVLALQSNQEGLFQEEGRWQALLARWQEIAGRYAAWGGVAAYDLLDEPAAPDSLAEEQLRALGAPRRSAAALKRGSRPGEVGGRAWSALAARLTQAIRVVDERGVIMVQAPGGAPEGFAHLRPTRDGNTCYAFHCFAPRGFTMQGVEESAGETSPARAAPLELQGYVRPAPATALPDASVQATRVGYPGVVEGERWDRARIEKWMGPALEFARTYEAPLYVSAFGVSALAPRQGQLTWLRSLLGLCHAHDMGWAYWTYRAVAGLPFGLVCDVAPFDALPQFGNEQRLDYELLGVLQSEA